MIDGEGQNIVAEGFESRATSRQIPRQGESARKENSEIVLRELSDFAGEFVVSTAGPDLEAIIAGKGSGARRYSIDNQCTVANLDIGGGTTNVVLFDAGEVIAKGCVDIGGRLVKVTSDGRVEYISDSVLKMTASDGLSLNIGDEAQYTKIYRIGEIMAELFCIDGCAGRMTGCWHRSQHRAAHNLNFINRFGPYVFPAA